MMCEVDLCATFPAIVNPKRRSIRIMRPILSLEVDGRGGEIRTPDPLFPKQMRYQAALRPDCALHIAQIPD